MTQGKSEVGKGRTSLCVQNILESELMQAVNRYYCDKAQGSKKNAVLVAQEWN